MMECVHVKCVMCTTCTCVCTPMSTIAHQVQSWGVTLDSTQLSSNRWSTICIVTLFSLCWTDNSRLHDWTDNASLDTHLTLTMHNDVKYVYMYWTKPILDSTCSDTFSVHAIHNTMFAHICWAELIPDSTCSDLLEDTMHYGKQLLWGAIGVWLLSVCVHYCVWVSVCVSVCIMYQYQTCANHA